MYRYNGHSITKAFGLMDYQDVTLEIEMNLCRVGSSASMNIDT